MIASGVRPSKRTRKDPSDPSGNPKSTITPFEASKCKLVEMLATLPTLRESQKTYLLDTHVHFIKLRKTLKNLHSRKTEASVEFYKLRSTRFNFDLSVSDQLYSEKKADIDAMRETCTLAIKIMQEKLREEVVKVIKLEIDSVLKRIKSLYLDTVSVVAKTLAMLDPSVDDDRAHDICRFCFDKAAHAPVLFKHSGFDNANDFYDQIFENERQADPASVQQRTPYRHTADTQYSVTATTPAVVTFLSVIKSLFTTSWDIYVSSELEREKSQAVHQFIKTITTAKASETTAMQVDDIQAPDNPTLDETIKRAVALEGKKIRSELQKDLRPISKNSTRGGTKSTASLKKKTVSFQDPPEDDEPTKPSKSRNRKGRRKEKQVDESDNDSTNGNRRRNRGRKSSKKNKKQSTPRGRR